MHRVTQLSILALVLVATGLGDTLRLRDGRTITGTWLGGDARNVRFSVRGQDQQFPTAQIDEVSFDDAAPVAGGDGSSSTGHEPVPAASGNKGASPSVALPPTAPGIVATVAGVSEGLTYINNGSTNGLRVGQTLQVYRVTTVPGLTDDSGRPLTRKKFICTLTLSDVENRDSSGRCVGDPPARLDLAEGRVP